MTQLNAAAVVCHQKATAQEEPELRESDIVRCGSVESFAEAKTITNLDSNTATTSLRPSEAHFHGAGSPSKPATRGTARPGTGHYVRGR